MQPSPGCQISQANRPAGPRTNGGAPESFARPFRSRCAFAAQKTKRRRIAGALHATAHFLLFRIKDHQAIGGFRVSSRQPRRIPHNGEPRLLQQVCTTLLGKLIGFDVDICALLFCEVQDPLFGECLGQRPIPQGHAVKGKDLTGIQGRHLEILCVVYSRAIAHFRLLRTHCVRLCIAQFRLGGILRLFRRLRRAAALAGAAHSIAIGIGTVCLGLFPRRCRSVR